MVRREKQLWNIFVFKPLTVRKLGTHLPGNSHDNGLALSLMEFEESSREKQGKGH